MAQVGSLNSWLLDPTVISSSPAYVHHTLAESLSPFAIVACHELRRSTEPVPIPKLHPSRSTSRSIATDLPIDQDLANSIGAAPLAAQVLSAFSSSVEFTSIAAHTSLEKSSCAWDLEQSGGRPLSGHRKHSQAVGESGSPLSIALKASSPPVDAPACEGYSPERAMPASSLPLQATQAPVSLASLCTALSTPATAAHKTSLAEAKAPNAARQSSSSPSLDQVTTVAAFNASMALGPLTAALAEAAAAAEAADGKVYEAHVVTSTKRGLYEGTVRGGSVRNRWLWGSKGAATLVGAY